MVGLEITAHAGAAGGEPRDYLVSYAPALDEGGRAVGFTTAVLDITARKRAEMALRASEERFRAVFEHAAVGIARVGLDGRWLEVNQRLCDIIGRDRDALLAATFQDVTHPDDLDADLAEVQAVLAGRGRSYRMEKRYLRPDGSVVWVLLTVALLRTPSGEPDYFISAVEDISARKAAEEALRELNATLEERVADRTRQLQETVAELDAFAYTVSHDLRAPLRGIEGFARILREEHAGGLGETGQRYATRIYAAAERMDQLIQDLLAYSRLGRVDLELRQVELEAVVEASLGDHRAVLDAAGAEVTVERPLPAVLGNRAVLSQIVGNLLTNAAKFVAKGTAPHIRVRAEREAGRVCLWVEDNGIGIEDEYRERVFNVFERLHGQEYYSGTGIGLAVVKKGAERLDGRAGMEPNPAGGSRFWVELPAAREG